MDIEKNARGQLREINRIPADYIEEEMKVTISEVIMRYATKEEIKKVNNYYESISEKTGVNFFDL